jgi:endo-1,4-beta-xylanase
LGLLGQAAAGAADDEAQSPRPWNVSDPLFLPGSEMAFDSIAVKDPTIVFHDDAWHLFYTARGKRGYSLGYATAHELDDLQNGRRFQLRHLGTGPQSYAAAPQVFYFAPQETWYLIYQTMEDRYQPVYSTTQDISKPELWTAPLPLVEKSDVAKWIDFWLIGDDTRMHLFYTREHESVWMMSTSLKDFPEGFSDPREVFGPVHEAVHVYRVLGKQKWHMLYELRDDDGTRSFGLAEADAIAGPWANITDAYASPGHLRWSDEAVPWTEEVSHGEFLRTGSDHELVYDAEDPRLLIQGLRKVDRVPDYALLPWRLGLLSR